MEKKNGQSGGIGRGPKRTFTTTEALAKVLDSDDSDVPLTSSDEDTSDDETASKVQDETASKVQDETASKVQVEKLSVKRELAVTFPVITNKKDTLIYKHDNTASSEHVHAAVNMGTAKKEVTKVTQKHKHDNVLVARSIVPVHSPKSTGGHNSSLLQITPNRSKRENNHDDLDISLDNSFGPPVTSSTPSNSACIDLDPNENASVYMDFDEAGVVEPDEIDMCKRANFVEESDLTFVASLVEGDDDEKDQENESMHNSVHVVPESDDEGNHYYEEVRVPVVPPEPDYVSTQTAKPNCDRVREEDTQNGWSWPDEDTGPEIVHPFEGSTGLKCTGNPKTPGDFLDLMLGDRVFDLMAHSTNQYVQKAKIAKRNNAPVIETIGNECKYARIHKWFDTNTDEIKRFFGLLLIVGIVRKPKLEQYWSTDEMIRTPFFPRVMSRNRFQALLWNLHINDQSLINPKKGAEGHDPLAKIRPMVDTLTANFKNVYKPKQNISLDESCCPFKGRAPFVVYNPKKPNRFHIKMFMVSEAASGYISGFEIYTGKKTQPDTVIGGRGRGKARTARGRAPGERGRGKARTARGRAPGERGRGKARTVRGSVLGGRGRIPLHRGQGNRGIRQRGGRVLQTRGGRKAMVRDYSSSEEEEQENTAQNISDIRRDRAIGSDSSSSSSSSSDENEVDDPEEYTKTTETCLQLLRKTGVLDKGYNLYCDNYYSSPQLFDALFKEKTAACGTVRLNRKGLPMAMTKKDIKMKKGDIIYRRKGNLLATKWLDKRYVSVLSTIHAAKDYVLKKKRFDGSVITKPESIYWYNKYMSGVDLTDQYLQYYSFLRKSVKWPLKLLIHMVNMAVCNAFILYKKYGEGKRKRQDRFRLACAKHLLKGCHANVLQQHGQDDGSAIDRLTSRHFLETIPNESSRKRRPARYCKVCNLPLTDLPEWMVGLNEGKRKVKYTTYQCKQCKLEMCIEPCFELFHTTENYKTHVKRHLEQQALSRMYVRN